MSRDDIDHIFKAWSFKICRTAWEAITNFNVSEQEDEPSLESLPVPDTTPDLRKITPLVPLQVPDTTPDSRKITPSGSSSSKKRLLFEKFKSNSAAKVPKPGTVSYPLGIEHPFPITKEHRLYLQNTEKEQFIETYTNCVKIIDAIYLVIFAKIKRKPTKTERDMIAMSLCREFPVLTSYKDGEYGHAALSYALRKKATNHIRRKVSLQKKLFPTADLGSKENAKNQEIDDNDEVPLSDADGDTDKTEDADKTVVEVSPVVVPPAKQKGSKQTTSEDEEDDMDSQARHNKLLRCELKKKRPNRSTVDKLFLKGSQERIDWIHSCPGGTRASSVLNDYPLLHGGILLH
ncbi:uncharacterized protein LOC135493771 [Lineus longissimus]|uniref:uncharacterized protein LOC135493771 n=1 Tax=Lineus longissimus TaxID=88925 RepID=UPI00315DFA91